jgi:hypothetical protein
MAIGKIIRKKDREDLRAAMVYAARIGSRKAI